MASEHKSGCDALGGYGHGVGPCSCGASDKVKLPEPVAFCASWDPVAADAFSWSPGEHCKDRLYTEAQMLAIYEQGRLAGLAAIPLSASLALGLAIDALENEPPEGRDWPVNWPLIAHGLKELRNAIAAPGAGKES